MRTAKMAALYVAVCVFLVYVTTTLAVKYLPN
jgi:hypothetical protein